MLNTLQHCSSGRIFLWGFLSARTKCRLSGRNWEQSTLSRHQISLYAFASLYRCGPFEKLEHILQNAVLFVNAFLEFFRKKFG